MKYILLTALIVTHTLPTSAADLKAIIDECRKTGEQIRQYQNRPKPDNGIAANKTLMVTVEAPPGGTHIANRVLEMIEAGQHRRDNGLTVHLYKGRNQCCFLRVNDELTTGRHRIWITYEDEQFIQEVLPVLLNKVYGVQIAKAERG